MISHNTDRGSKEKTFFLNFTNSLDINSLSFKCKTYAILQYWLIIFIFSRLFTPLDVDLAENSSNRFLAILSMSPKKREAPSKSTTQPSLVREKQSASSSCHRSLLSPSFYPDRPDRPNTSTRTNDRERRSFVLFALAIVITADRCGLGDEKSTRGENRQNREE